MHHLQLKLTDMAFVKRQVYTLISLFLTVLLMFVGLVPLNANASLGTAKPNAANTTVFEEEQLETSSRIREELCLQVQHPTTISDHAPLEARIPAVMFVPGASQNLKPRFIPYLHVPRGPPGLC